MKSYQSNYQYILFKYKTHQSTIKLHTILLLINIVDYYNFRLMNSEDNDFHEQPEQPFQEDYNSEDIIEKSLTNTSQIKNAQDNQLFSKDQSPNNRIDQPLQQELPVSVRNMSNEAVDLNTDIAQFKQYGPAVYLLFVFIKKIIILFSILTVINLILIFYNFAVGETYPVKAEGISIAFARASVGSFSAGSPDQQRTKLLYQIIVSLNLIGFFCFWLYWRAFSSREAEKIQRRLELSNFCTVIVEGKGIQCASQNDVQEFMRQFGVVKEVVRVLDRREEVALASQIVALEQQIHKTTNRQQNEENIPQKESQKLIKKYQLVQKLRQNLKKQVRKNIGNKNIRFYVKLDSRFNQKKAVQKLKNQKCCWYQEPAIYVLEGLQVKGKLCEAQSWGIYWQNQHVGFKHNIIPNVVLLLLVNLIPMVIIIVIGLISVASDPVYYQPFLASNNLSEAQMMTQTNRAAIASWCIGNHYSSNMQSICSPFMQSSKARFGLYLIIALCTALSQYAMKITIIWFTKYFRFKDHAQKSNTIMLHLFLNYSVIYIVIPLAVQANLFQTAMSDVMAQFITIEPLHSRLTQLRQYYDYVPQWYADYGFQLILNYCMIIVLPYSILPLGHFLFKKIKSFLSYSKSRQDKKDIESQVQQFELQDHFANLFMSIIVGMAFAGGMPIMFPLILVSLLVRYFSMKYLFIYTSTFPKLTDRLFASKMPHLLLIIIVIYVANTIWALGVQQIFTPKYKLFQGFGITEDSNAHTIGEVFLVLFRRMLNNWPILFVFCSGLVVVGVRRRLSNTWLRILLMFGLGQRPNEGAQNNMEMQQIEEQQQLDKSYDPLNNRHYRIVFQQLKN